jgi:hypothetical protein
MICKPGDGFLLLLLDWRVGADWIGGVAAGVRGSNMGAKML